MPVLDADADADADEPPAVLVLVLLLLDEELHAARADPVSRATRTTASCLRAVRIPELLIRFMLPPRCFRKRCFGTDGIATTADGAEAAPTVVCDRTAASLAWCRASARPG